MKKKYIIRYSLEFLVIFSSIFFSFYLEDVRKINQDFIIKNELVNDLIISIEDDLKQIKDVKNILKSSDEAIESILNDIDGEKLYINDVKLINKILKINVGLSFFSKDGIYNQLISTGTFGLIKNQKLKKTLLEIYNHNKNRNFAISKEIDQFAMSLHLAFKENFRIRSIYDTSDGKFYGSQKVINSNFNKTYYLSNNFYSLLSQSQDYISSYLRLIDDIQNNYNTALSLSKLEIKK